MVAGRPTNCIRRVQPRPNERHLRREHRRHRPPEAHGGRCRRQRAAIVGPPYRAHRICHGPEHISSRGRSILVGAARRNRDQCPRAIDRRRTRSSVSRRSLHRVRRPLRSSNPRPRHRDESADRARSVRSMGTQDATSRARRRGGEQYAPRDGSRGWEGAPTTHLWPGRRPPARLVARWQGNPLRSLARRRPRVRPLRRARA